MGSTAAILIGVALLAGAGSVALSLQRRARSRDRLWGDEGAGPDVAPRFAGRLGTWLSLAGVRGAGASARFVAACLGFSSVGVALGLAASGSQTFLDAAYGISGLPVVGVSLARVTLWLPWLGALALALLPILWVRARRERRVAAVEEDLPLALELLATLGEAGLGFDASLERVLESEPDDRPLAQELRRYQAEVLAGGSRSECLHRVGRHLRVPTLTSAVAALVQAEEMGSGLADVLRPLAEDLRLRRRERALARAEALPEKLVFPLVLGFLPGLLVWTLGPSFYQLFGIVDSILRGGR